MNQLLRGFIFFCMMACACGLFGQAAFTVTVTGVPQKENNSVTLIRVSALKGRYQVDTFSKNAGHTATLRIFDIRYPSTGWLVIASDTIRQIFIVPGHTLNIAFQVSELSRQNFNTQSSLSNGQPSLYGNVTVSGSAARMQQMFDSLLSYTLPSFRHNFRLAHDNDRNQLLDTALKTADKTDLRYRPLKDYYTHQILLTAIDSSRTILSLNDAQLRFLPYYKSFAYTSFKTDVDQHYQARLNYLLFQQEGKPAFAFALADTSGTTFRLSDFKGKVVYLDFWASWCLPCRLESANLKQLTKRMESRHDLVFIGVSVGDKVNDWKKALRQDRPTWLQLRDKSNLVANAYAVRSLPRYVLIGKSGNVAGYFAPAPSEHERIAALIERELNN